jgi:hypothetical protein
MTDKPASLIPRDDERKKFEQWYCENAFDFARDPIGSLDCMLQWGSWRAAKESEMTEARAREILDIAANVSCHPNGLYKDHGFSVEYIPGEKVIMLNGAFTAEELKAIVWWVRNKT